MITPKCRGLIRGVAMSSTDNRTVGIDSASPKNGPIYCGECFSDAIVKDGPEKRKHFAHKARTSPVCSDPESNLHRDAKNEICAHLRDMFPDGMWAVERHIKGNDIKNLSPVTPDISGRADGVPVVVEVQASVLPLKTIVKRTEEYARRGCSIVWVIPLTEPLGDAPFRPRQFEQFLHAFYFGRTYYWCDGYGADVDAVHFAPTERYIEPSEWRDAASGEVKSVGDCWKTYKTIKMPLVFPRVNISTFRKEDAAEFKMKKYKKDVYLPNRLLFKDQQPKWWEAAL